MRGAILLMIASTMLSLGVAELGLRFARPNWTIFFPPVCFREDLYQRWDAYGYRLWPSRAVQQTYDGPPARTVTYRSNSDGFRTRERQVADPRVRVVVLGDSLTFGVGVEAEERFTERIEAAEPSWRVDNLGMIGFGPDLMLRSLEAVGLDPAPKVVVMAFFSDDMRRVAPLYAGAGFPIPRYELQGGALVSVPYPEPWPWERTLLVQGAYYAAWRYTAVTWPVTAAVLDRFRQDGEEHAFAPVLAFLPSRREGWDDRQRRDWLRDWAQRTGTAFVDLSDVLREQTNEPLFLADGVHLTAAGHRVVAEQLRPVLVQASGG